MSRDMKVFLAVTIGVVLGVYQILATAFVSELLGLGQWTGAIVATAGLSVLGIAIACRRRT